jgi:hypothetical protein
VAPAQGSPASVSPESPYGALRPLPGPFSPSESTKGQEVPRDLQVRALKDALAWANSGTYRQQDILISPRAASLDSTLAATTRGQRKLHFKLELASMQQHSQKRDVELENLRRQSLLADDIFLQWQRSESEMIEQQDEMRALRERVHALEQQLASADAEAPDTGEACVGGTSVRSRVKRWLPTTNDPNAHRAVEARRKADRAMRCPEQEYCYYSASRRQARGKQAHPQALGGAKGGDGRDRGGGGGGGGEGGGLGGGKGRELREVILTGEELRDFYFNNPDSPRWAGTEGKEGRGATGGATSAQYTVSLNPKPYTLNQEEARLRSTHNARNHTCRRV